MWELGGRGAAMLLIASNGISLGEVMGNPLLRLDSYGLPHVV